MAQRIPDRVSSPNVRDTVHSMVEQHEPGLKTLSKDDWWAFEMFLSYWLSALFVLVEGFNKLKLTDTRVQKLFKEHVRHLKMVRHTTCHFVLEVGPGHVEMIGQLDWAEQLHNAIGDHVMEVIKRKHTLKEFWRRGRDLEATVRSCRQVRAFHQSDEKRRAGPAVNMIFSTNGRALSQAPVRKYIKNTRVDVAANWFRWDD